MACGWGMGTKVLTTGNWRVDGGGGLAVAVDGSGWQWMAVVDGSGWGVVALEQKYRIRAEYQQSGPKWHERRLWLRQPGAAGGHCAAAAHHAALVQCQCTVSRGTSDA